MTFTHKDSHTISIPLTSQAHIEAEAAYAKQIPSQRQQTYLNVLAVHAVKQYLQWLAIPVEWNNCDSRDPTMRRFLDVADLEVKGCGRLECRPVLPDGKTLTIPSEAQSDRIGYVAVQFDEELATASLLGFAQTVAQNPLPLSALKPMEALLEIVGKAPAVLTPVEDVPEELLNWREPVSLNEWFNQTVNELVTKGWQTLEAIENFLAPETRMELAFRVRGVVDPKRGKLLGLEKGDEQVALVVGLQKADPPETEISVEVYPTGSHIYLPRDLELIVLDEMGEAVIQAQARSNKKIQMEFSGEAGEEFSIRLALGEFSVTEAFRI